MTKKAKERLKDLDLPILSTSEKAKTPYALVLNDHFDFDQDDSNLWRMVREAESQNADLVYGSWRNELGQWSSPCLHYQLQNYTLHVWDGYYKSISSMKYCDMGFGPLLLRTEYFEKKLSSHSVADRIDYHLRRPKLRVINCLDCMFYQSNPPQLTKEMMQPLAYVFTLNRINYLGQDFEFTCPEAGIKCDRFFYTKAGLAQPPCCLRILTGMSMALFSEYEKKDLTQSLCIYCGQVLAALKMPGGQLPWDLDVDIPILTKDFKHAVSNTVSLNAR